VYPIRSGRARRLSGTAVSVSSPSGPTFQYYHLKLAVRTGQNVRAQRTVLGWITPGRGTCICPRSIAGTT
jgi:hypothetical protein